MRPPHRLSADLAELALRSDGEALTVGRLLDLLSERGFGLLLVVLSLPSALPVPAAGYSTPFGAMLMLLGLQLVWGRQLPWLPESARRIRFSGAAARRIFEAGAAFFRRIEHLLRPRLSWVESPLVLRLIGLLVCLMAGLMILPIPLTNTLPAMVIFALGVGIIEKDGLAVLAALAFAVAAVLLYAAALAVVLYYGLAGFGELKELIKARLR